MAQGVLTYFGTYTLNGNGKVLTQHVESAHSRILTALTGRGPSCSKVKS